MIDNRIKNFIKRHSREIYPDEACGFIVQKSNKFLCIKCKNISKTPNITFEISPYDYLNIKNNTDKIHYIYHSHPNLNNDKCSFSEKDKNCSEVLNIPMILFCLENHELNVFTPNDIKYNYIGRYYEYGKYDCFSLIVDFLKNERNINIKYDKKDLYIDHLIFYKNFLEDQFKKIFLENNFIILNKNETLQDDDILLFDMFNDSCPKHLGIYLGQETFLHQPYSRLSRIENNWNIYKNKIHSIFRKNI